jgi:cytoskeletal protein RodZ
MEERRSMKIVYILLVLILAASALGCVGNKQSEVTPTQTTQAPATQTPPTQVETSVAPTETPVSAAATTTPSGNDQFATQSDISTIDSLVNDSSMDIPLYDVNI